MTHVSLLSVARLFPRSNIQAWWGVESPLPSLEKVNVGLSFHTGAWGREIMEKAGNPRHKQDLRVKEGFPKITTVQEPGPVWVQANGHQQYTKHSVKAEVNDLAVVSRPYKTMKKKYY